MVDLIREIDKLPPSEQWPEARRWLAMYVGAEDTAIIHWMTTYNTSPAQSRVLNLLVAKAGALCSWHQINTAADSKEGVGHGCASAFVSSIRSKIPATIRSIEGLGYTMDTDEAAKLVPPPPIKLGEPLRYAPPSATPRGFFPWSAKEVSLLMHGRRAGTRWRDIAAHLGRTETSCVQKWRREMGLLKTYRNTRAKKERRNEAV